MKTTHLLSNTLKNIKRSLMVSQNEPQVKQKRDRYGNSYWQVLDRRTNQSYTFGSDSEAIAWIEQCYHSA
jgi:hypothetical protein